MASVLLVGSLAGCASTTSGPTKTGSTKTGATAVPTASSNSARPDDPGSAQPNPAETPAAIVVGPEELQVVNGNGDVLDSGKYLDPIEGIVTALTEATGAEPEIEFHEAGIESPSGTYYRWGGLQLNDVDLDSVEELDPEWYLKVDGATAGALTVATIDRIAIGQSQAEVETLVPGTLTASEVNGTPVMDGDYHAVWLGNDSAGFPRSMGLWVRLEGSPFKVTLIGAPNISWGP